LWDIVWRLCCSAVVVLLLLCLVLSRSLPLDLSLCL
jgi:hypothetical protein